MYLITRNTPENHSDVSQDVVKQFEKAILGDESQQTIPLVNRNRYFSTLLKWIILKLNVQKIARTTARLDNTFCIHMGPDFGKSVRYYLASKMKYAYFFDVWPYTFNHTKTFITRLKIDYVFISSLQAAQYFNSQGFENVFWIPEGIDPDEYKFNTYPEKDIDVLELGRKYLKFHDKVARTLSENRMNHLYEEQPGKIIFPNRKSFIEGLARTRISICYPRSTTHPESAGIISTLTNRYLQSMVSKCLIVGESPSEIHHLFDYDPVVPIDLDNAETEIMNILNNFDSYIPLIEKNYRTVIESHRWENRWNSIKQLVEAK